MVVNRDLGITFRGIASDAERGAVLKPLLHAYLFDARFPPRFSVEFRNEDTVREPDGWFHPSTHPSWPERKLFLYLTQPDSIDIELLEYMSSMSVTMGKAMHSFIQMCLRDQGVLMTKDELEEEGIPHDEEGEPSLLDERYGRRGHTDGILKLYLPLYRDFSRQIFEFKTSNMMKLNKIEDMDLEAFRETWPGYWMQVQEYMAMSGYQVAVVLFLGMGYPWTIKEFHVPADDRWQYQMREKYSRVLSAVAEDEMPAPCCAPGSKEASACEARRACPIGLMQIGKK